MRFSYRTILLIVLSAVGSFDVSAQGIRNAITLQDLVGEWELVSLEADPPVSKTLSKGVIRIAVKNSEVTLFRRFEDQEGFTERTLVYSADGSGETNRWTLKDGFAMEEKTKTTWKKGVLTIKGRYRIERGSMDIEGRYRLSNDLLKLEYEEVQRRPGPRSGPFNTGFTTRTVFRRV